jgi:cell division septation protein DedD
MAIDKRSRVPCALAVLFCILMWSGVLPANAADNLTGVDIIEFTLPEGAVKVFLPDDIAAGDTISAYIGLYPSGNSPDLKDQNARTLNEFIVESTYGSVPVNEGALTMKIPPDPEGNVLKFTLTDGEKTLGASYVQIRRYRQPTEAAGSPTPFDYQCPLMGQSGRLIEIKGPFDGDFDTTDFSIGGQKPLILAESERKLVFETPVAVTGSVELVLKERDVVVKRPFTCLQVLKIGEDGAVSVSSYSIEDADTAYNKRKVGGAGEKSYPSTSQNLEFGGIKAEETIDEGDMREEVEIASEPSPSVNQISVILANQLSAPFSGVVHVSEAGSAPESLSDIGEDASVMPAAVDEQAEVTEADKTTSDSPNVMTPPTPEDTEIAAVDKNNDQIALILENQLASSFISGPLAYTPDAGHNLHDGGGYTVQVASCKHRSDADTLAGKLRSKGYPVFVVPADIPGKGKWYRVRVGTFNTSRQAREFGENLKQKERTVKSVFVTDYY